MASHTIAQTQRRIENIAGQAQFASTLDFDAMALSAELAQAAAAVRNRLEQGPLAESKLSFSAYQVLWIVWSWQPIETRAIAAEAGLGKAALSGILNTLERRNLITRTKSNDDARIVEVALTDLGRVQFEVLLPAVNWVENEVLSEIHANNRDLIIDTLRKLATS